MTAADKSFTQAAQQLTPAIYQSLKRAVELGKWPDGRRLTGEQVQTCLQAMISYEALHLAPEARTGFMPQVCESEAKAQERSQLIASDRSSPRS